jgi:Protein of unknown function (DUF3347)
MKMNYFIPVLLTFLAFTACKNDTKNEEPESVEVNSGNDITQMKEDKSEKDISFDNPKMGPVFNAYIDLKDALVGTNSEKASVAASQLLTAATDAGGAQTTLKALQNIVETDAVEVQRAAFVIVTDAVGTMLEGEVASGTIYKQYCPMAFDNTGASWLSSSSDIKNPYFGDKMLRCGRIEATIE